MQDFEQERRKLVEYIRASTNVSEKVLRAIARVRRELFLPESQKKNAYLDTALPTCMGQTISQPSIVAIMTQLLDPKEKHRVLEVGAGTGYQAAVLAELVGEKGHVYTLEILGELVEFCRKNLKAAGYSERVTVSQGDGGKGLKQHAPFDRIMVTCAAPSVPKPLVEQLKEGGRLVAPVGSRWVQRLVCLEKKTNRVLETQSIPCVFVPLLGEHGFER